MTDVKANIRRAAMNALGAALADDWDIAATQIEEVWRHGFSEITTMLAVWTVAYAGHASGGLRGPAVDGVVLSPGGIVDPVDLTPELSWAVGLITAGSKCDGAAIHTRLMYLSGLGDGKAQWDHVCAVLSLVVGTMTHLPFGHGICTADSGPT